MFKSVIYAPLPLCSPLLESGVSREPFEAFGPLLKPLAKCPLSLIADKFHLNPK